MLPVQNDSASIIYPGRSFSRNRIQRIRTVQNTIKNDWPIRIDRQMSTNWIGSMLGYSFCYELYSNSDCDSHENIHNEKGDAAPYHEFGNGVFDVVELVIH